MEWLTVIVTLIKELLPIILELINKTPQQRAEAQIAWKAAQTAAVKAGDWKGIVITSLLQRSCDMDDAGLASLAAAMKDAHAGLSELAGKEA